MFYHLLKKIRFIFLKEKEQLQNMYEDLTFNLTYDLKNSAPCTLCPILNDYNDISKRSFRAEVSKPLRDNFIPDLFSVTRSFYSCLLSDLAFEW